MHDDVDPTDKGVSPTPPPRPHHCARGWLNPDSEHPVPCPVCKPHLRLVHDPKFGDARWTVTGRTA